MAAKPRRENLVEKKVTYTLLKGKRIYVIENVPARVDAETGEQYFSPQTVEQLRRIITQKRNPSRFMQAPVYEFQ